MTSAAASTAVTTAAATEETPSQAGQSGYAFGVRVPYDHATAVSKTKEALKEQGFGVLTEIDVQKTMKEKTGHEMGKYLILGACNPPLAHRALQAEKEIGALLPCNVVVYEDSDAAGQTVVIAQDPQIMVSAAGNPALAPVAAEARERLARALEALGGTPR
ncbi:MAG: DUF302 domain-containing protein [Chloroflexi bacterium]|nr:DUF302 domain-containing protein [Chloroflexota bacterium]